MAIRLTASEEERFLRDTARDFFSAKMPVSHLRQLRDSGDLLAYDPALWQQMAELGWCGMLVPEALGGSDFGLTGMGAVMEEAGRHLSPSPLLSTAVIAACVFRAAGDEEQLKHLTTGESITALALDEQGWHAPEKTACRAQKTSEGYVLDGAKRFVGDGNEADRYLLVARTAGNPGDTAGLSLFLLNAKAAGLKVTALSTADSRNSADLELKQVHLKPEALLGEAGQAMEIVEPALDAGRACLAAEMLGGAQQVFDITLDYLKERRQFKVPIGSFQALQHRAAMLYCDIELARSAVMAALVAHCDKPDDFPRLASLAKAQAGKAFYRASIEAVQMHGGIGVTDEVDIGLYLKRARVAEQTLGDYIWNSKRYATLSGF